ncbi:MAG: hypothetical protein ACM3U2_06470 [Deltaproteobacteria bacterium]
MNTSFRTAFWAMCLGLTVPMVLFVGVEMTSGGRATQDLSMTASDRRESLRSYWKKSEAHLAHNDSPSRAARGKSQTGAAASESDHTPLAVASRAPGRQPATRPSPEVAEAKVTLGPQLEADPAAESAMRRDRRVPAVVTGQRPSAEILPERGEKLRDDGAIQERLDGIAQQLDRLGRTIATQAEREPPADPVKQTVELLRELRHARELEEPIATGPRSSPLETDDEQPEPVPRIKDGKVSQPSDSVAAHESPSFDPSRASKKPRPLTKIYRPRYLSATALQALVEPLLTDGIGKAGAADARTDESAPTAGGDVSPAPVSALVVRDLPEVLRKIDRLVLKVDVRPIQVVIEATVITVGLNGTTPHGIDLQEFNVSGQSSAVARTDGIPTDHSSTIGPRPNSRTAGPPSATGGSRLTHGFGLKCGVLHGNPREFLTALQAAAQSRSVNAWQLNVLNRQSTQLMLYDPSGPEGSVPRAATGAILKIRPIVTEKGLLHLDIQRPLDRDATAAGIRSAALTSQVILREGETLVLGGFFAERLDSRFSGTPGIDGSPFVGQRSGETSAVVERTETIVLLTPHVIRPPTEPEDQVSRKGRPKSKAAGRPILKETTAQRGATGRKAAQQTAATGPLQPAVPGVPSAKPSAARPARPDLPRRLPHSDDVFLQPTGSQAAAGESAEDSVDRIPVLELPREPELRPIIRPAGAIPQP